MTLEDILANIKIEPASCHTWQRFRQPAGYGTVWFEGKKWQVHRLIWTIEVGPIPNGLLVCHHCDNPPCCNVSHLFLGTSKDNSEDMASKGRANGGRFRGNEVAGSKLTEFQVLEIRKDDRAYKILSDNYGVSIAQVSRIKNKERWGWL